VRTNLEVLARNVVAAYRNGTQRKQKELEKALSQLNPQLVSALTALERELR
jgi:hypothetical protein